VAINNQALGARAALMESMSSCRPNILALRFNLDSSIELSFGKSLKENTLRKVE